MVLSCNICPFPPLINFFIALQTCRDWTCVIKSQWQDDGCNSRLITHISNTLALNAENVMDRSCTASLYFPYLKMIPSQLKLANNWTLMVAESSQSGSAPTDSSHTARLYWFDLLWTQYKYYNHLTLCRWFSFFFLRNNEMLFWQPMFVCLANRVQCILAELDCYCYCYNEKQQSCKYQDTEM